MGLKILESSDCPPTTINMLTDDLVTEIIKRLPVESILRCKSVCKPWLSLISTPNFINSQLLYSLTKLEADRILIDYHPDDGDDDDDDSVPLLNLESLELETSLGLPYSRGDFSFEPDYKIVGSCNGIVCVTVYKYPRPLVHEMWRYLDIDPNPDVYIWNPATRQSKLVAPLKMRSRVSMMAEGFGFDPISNDFKYLRVVSSVNRPFYAEVYSANTDVWHTVDPRPTDSPEVFNFAVCRNGVLCGTGYLGMMAFDLNREVFTCGIRVPVKYSDVITIFNDCVAYLTSPRNDSNSVIKLWTLDNEACLRDREVEASWSLMLSVDVDYPVASILGYFNGGDLMFKAKSGDPYGFLLLYNSIKKEARDIPVFIFMHPVFKYNESMVSVTGFRQVNWKSHGDNVN